MALQETPEGPRKAAHQAVSLDRVLGIMGTGRLEPAGRRQPRRYPLPIQADQSNRESLHGLSSVGANNPSRRRADSHASRNCACGTVRASRLGKTRRSRAGANRGRTNRANSRKIRFARFLATACPRRLPTTIPIRLCRRSSSCDPDWVVATGQASRLNSGVWSRRPSFLTRSISTLFRRKNRRSPSGRTMSSVSVTRQAGRVPWPADGPALSGHSWCSSVCGIRDPFFASDSTVVSTWRTWSAPSSKFLEKAGHYRDHNLPCQSRNRRPAPKRGHRLVRGDGNLFQR